MLFPGEATALSWGVPASLRHLSSFPPLQNRTTENEHSPGKVWVYSYFVENSRNWLQLRYVFLPQRFVGGLFQYIFVNVCIANRQINEQEEKVAWKKQMSLQKHLWQAPEKVRWQLLRVLAERGNYGLWKIFQLLEPGVPRVTGLLGSSPARLCHCCILWMGNLYSSLHFVSYSSEMGSRRRNTAWKVPIKLLKTRRHMHLRNILDIKCNYWVLNSCSMSKVMFHFNPEWLPLQPKEEATNLKI